MHNSDLVVRMHSQALEIIERHRKTYERYCEIMGAVPLDQWSAERCSEAYKQAKKETEKCQSQPLP